MVVDVDCEFGSCHDGTVLVFRIIGVVDVNGVGEGGCGNGVAFAERGVNVSGCCARIEESVNFVLISVTVFDFDFYGGEMGMLKGG